MAIAGPEQRLDELTRRRADAQLLSSPQPRAPAQAVSTLLAVQAQDRRSAGLALRARAQGLTARVVDDTLARGGELVVAWLLRGTLHLVHREDYRWLLALTAPQRRTANHRRLAQEGVSLDDAERALRLITEVLGEQGPMRRADLAEHLGSRGIRTRGQATPHLLMYAALRGVIVLGPMVGGDQAFVLTRDWVDAQRETEDRGAMLGELARRYLAAHGPATHRDLAAWAGLPLRDARAGLRAIAAELEELDRIGPDLLDLSDRPDFPPVPSPPRLLPSFDPYLLGWRDRTPAVPVEHLRTVHPGGGTLRAVTTVAGRVVGTWSVRRTPGLLRVTIAPLDPLPDATMAALAAEAEDVARYEGRDLAEVCFDRAQTDARRPTSSG